MRRNVLVGAVKAWEEGVGDAQWRNVIPGTKVKNPKFKGSQAGYDIMLFKIETVTKAHLQPVKLNSNSASPSTGNMLTTIGMGALNSQGDRFDPNLRWVEVQNRSRRMCRRYYGPDTLCAGSPGKDSCLGDSVSVAAGTCTSRPALYSAANKMQLLHSPKSCRAALSSTGRVSRSALSKAAGDVAQIQRIPGATLLFRDQSTGFRKRSACFPTTVTDPSATLCILVVAACR